MKLSVPAPFQSFCEIDPGPLLSGNQKLNQEKAMSYYFCTVVEATQEEAERLVTEELKKEGFGVLTEIDVQATMKAKLGADMKPYRILGACNPNFAFQAIGHEPRIGLMLPCNVIVREVDGKTEVCAVDPVASMKGVENSELGDVANQVREKLQRVIAALKR